MDAPTCPTCGETIDDDAADVCPYCGELLTPNVPALLPRGGHGGLLVDPSLQCLP